MVIDSCTGTGGFLISAMKKMIADAKGDDDKIKQIKSSQLIGVEWQSHIFALAVSRDLGCILFSKQFEGPRSRDELDPPDLTLTQ